MKRRPLPQVLRLLDEKFDCDYWIVKLHPKGRWALVLIRGEKRQSDGQDRV